MLDAAGLPRIRFRDLRHTAFTDTIQRGTPPHVVAKIVAHQMMTTTLAVYAKVVDMTLAAAPTVMDAAYRSADPETASS